VATGQVPLAGLTDLHPLEHQLASLQPTAGLIFDHAGNLYGTTENGGACDYGTAFEFSPAGGGNWTETVLHSFCNGGGDGYRPFAGLIIDHAGNPYGTAAVGGIGTSAFGTVFEIAP
jgi:uncharacterized repeat protein (TIGR03803 family)